MSTQPNTCTCVNCTCVNCTCSNCTCGSQKAVANTARA